ncbi:MAG: hypothetical protein L0312_22480, partial [Acidobacteria bacterium]|nr:hypothetical protein [Acidobacteriota bacterium]
MSQHAVFAQPSDGALSASGIAGSDLAVATPAELNALAASGLMLVGPVEAKDYRAISLQVLGQTVRLSGSRTTQTSLHGAFLRIEQNNVVVVWGRLLTSGEIEASAVSVASRPYVAGAQPLFLRGIISSLQANVGRLSVGNLAVDYTGALHTLDALTLSVGAEFVATGIQAFSKGSFVALTASARPSGIAGSDLTGIAGSDLNSRGITGSDLTGIAGSDL